MFDLNTLTKNNNDAAIKEMEKIKELLLRLDRNGAIEDLLAEIQRPMKQTRHRKITKRNCPVL